MTVTEKDFVKQVLKYYRELDEKNKQTAKLIIIINQKNILFDFSLGESSAIERK